MRRPYDGKGHRTPVERGRPIAMRVTLTLASAAVLACGGAKNLSPLLLNRITLLGTISASLLRYPHSKPARR